MTDVIPYIVCFADGVMTGGILVIIMVGMMILSEEKEPRRGP